MESGALDNLPLLFRSDFLTQHRPCKANKLTVDISCKSRAWPTEFDKPRKENLQAALKKKRIEYYTRGLVSYTTQKKNLYLKMAKLPQLLNLIITPIQKSESGQKVKKTD